MSRAEIPLSKNVVDGALEMIKHSNLRTFLDASSKEPLSRIEKMEFYRRASNTATISRYWDEILGVKDNC